MLKLSMMGGSIFIFIITFIGAIALAYFVGRLLEKAFHETQEEAVASVPAAHNDQQERVIHDLESKLTRTSTDLETAHVQLIQAEKMASLGQLAAGVAHEVNNPLSYVTTNLQLMQNYIAKLNDFEPFKNDPKCSLLHKDMAEVVGESIEGVHRIKNIINSMMLFSQNQTEQRQYSDINEIIENAVLLLWHEIKHKCDMVKDLAPLPQTLCYAKQLNHAIFNIIQNAYQAISEHGRISISSRMDGNWIVVVIQDDGKGIDEQYLPKIFDPFFKIDSSSPGIGIGLSVAYSIVKRHKGSIDIKSKIAGGTTVMIKLPLEQAAVS